MMVAVVVGAACGGGGARPFDAGSHVIAPVLDASIDLAACLEDAPVLDGGLDTMLGSDAGLDAPETMPAFDAAMGACGGEIALAGVTPLGAFAPTSATAAVGAPPHDGLSIWLVEKPASPPSGLQLIFMIPWDAVAQTYVGVHQVSGLLLGEHTGIPASVKVDVTSATVPYLPDGGHPSSGEARMTIMVTTGCGTFTGVLVAPYCSWQA